MPTLGRRAGGRVLCITCITLLVASSATGNTSPPELAEQALAHAAAMGCKAQKSVAPAKVSEFEIRGRTKADGLQFFCQHENEQRREAEVGTT